MATDIAARGIDVEALGHVVNFDVPMVPDDYIHRVGRTARAEATGEAFTFVSPQEEADLRAIESAIGKRLPRVTVPDFDYTARPAAEARDPAGRAHRGDSQDEGRAASAIRDEERAGQRPQGRRAGAPPSHGRRSARPRARRARRRTGWTRAWSRPRRPVVGRPREPVTLDDIRSLLDYHYWARDRLLAAVEPVTDEQRTRDMGSSFRSIHDTLVHLVAAEWVWYSRWNGVSPTSRARPVPFRTLPPSASGGARSNRRFARYVEAAGSGGLDRVYEFKSLAGVEGRAPLGRWCSTS